MNIKEMVKKALGVNSQQKNEIVRLRTENAGLRRELDESQATRKALAQALAEAASLAMWVSSGDTAEGLVGEWPPELVAVWGKPMAWHWERRTNVDGKVVLTLREGDEAKLIESLPPLLAWACEARNAMHRRGMTFQVSFLDEITRTLMEMAQRIYTERGDDRKSLIEARDQAVSIAMRVGSYAAYVRRDFTRHTPEKEKAAGEELVKALAGSALLIKDVIKHNASLKGQIGNLPDGTKDVFHRFMAEGLIGQDA